MESSDESNRVAGFHPDADFSDKISRTHKFLETGTNSALPLLTTVFQSTWSASDKDDSVYQGDQIFVKDSMDEKHYWWTVMHKHGDWQGTVNYDDGNEDRFDVINEQWSLQYEAHTNSVFRSSPSKVKREPY